LVSIPHLLPPTFHPLIPSTGDSSKYSTDYALGNFKPDGVAGLAFPQISEFNSDDYFTTLINEAVVTEARFGVKLATSKSELFLGGVNTDLFQGDLVVTPVTEEVSDIIAKRGRCAEPANITYIIGILADHA
jgi:hypothetical protein